MIEQSFVQRKAVRGATSLRTLSVKSVSASLKQHGLGVVSLTMDVCSKLLSQKIALLLDFLADDSIKSLLSKELRWINNQRKEGNNIYPFSRAIEFTQEMKRLLEQSQSNQNGLDWCRSVITETGNILAMARMVRTARRKVLGDEMPFLSPIDVSIVKGKDQRTVKSGTGVKVRSNAAAEVEENIFAVLNKPDPDIFQGFASIFKEALLEHEDSFMSGFHCMLPALCLCWMDASLQGKEMMHKKNIARGGYFTDDGFAVGLAFFLSVADQQKMYDRLNWFKSIQSKYASDEEDLMERKTAEEMKRDAKIAAAKQSSWFSSSGVDAAQEESEELKNLRMMEKRIEGNRREMAMLFFSMNEATAFLRNI
jgi:WASH complex subunit 7